MKPEVMQIISDARQLLIEPESWIRCFALSLDSDGDEVWEVADLENVDRLSFCGALDLAAHRRQYPKAVMDAVVRFVYPIVWQHISVPYLAPHELIEDLDEGGNFIYEELGYFNEQDSRTHDEVLSVLNTALAFGYTKTLPTLPTPQDAAQRAWRELAWNRQAKAYGCHRSIPKNKRRESR